MMNHGPVLWLTMLFAAGVGAAAASAGRITVDAGNGGMLQLADYEGKRTNCWMNAVAALKAGCAAGGGGNVLSETERKQLAVDFSNCQFREDDLPIKESSAEMAADAKAGDTLAYSVYTHHLLSVEVICMHLSQRIFQKATEEVTRELGKAGASSVEMLRGLEGGMSKVKEETRELKEELDGHTSRIKADVQQLQETADKVSENVVAGQEAVEGKFVSLEDRISDGTIGVERLHESLNGLSAKLMHVEASASQLAISQNAIGVVVTKVEGLVTYLVGSAFSLEALAYASFAVAFAFMATMPAQTRRCRLPVLTLVAVTLIAERPFHATNSIPLIWAIRRLSAALASCVLLTTWYRYRDPVRHIEDKIDTLQAAVDTMLLRFRSLSRSQSRARSLGQPPTPPSPVRSIAPPRQGSQPDAKLVVVSPAREASLRSASGRSHSRSEEGTDGARGPQPQPQPPAVTVKLSASWVPSIFGSFGWPKAVERGSSGSAASERAASQRSASRSVSTSFHSCSSCSGSSSSRGSRSRTSHSDSRSPCSSCSESASESGSVSRSRSPSHSRYSSSPASPARDHQSSLRSASRSPAPAPGDEEYTPKAPSCTPPRAYF